MRRRRKGRLFFFSQSHQMKSFCNLCVGERYFRWVTVVPSIFRRANLLDGRLQRKRRQWWTTRHISFHSLWPITLQWPCSATKPNFLLFASLEVPRYSNPFSSMPSCMRLTQRLRWRDTDEAPLILDSVKQQGRVPVASAASADKMRNMYMHTTTYADQEVESRTTYTPALDTISIITLSNEMYDNFCR